MRVSFTSNSFKNLALMLVVLLGFNAVQAQTCDVLNFPPPVSWTPSSSGIGANGFINGTNVFEDLQKAMYFDASASAGTYLTEVFVGFAAAGSADPNTVVGINVYDGTAGTPGLLLGTSSTTIGQIQADIAAIQYTDILFANPIALPVSKQFFVSVDISNLCWGCAVPDTLDIISNADGQTVPADTWEQQSTGVWARYDNAALSWDLNISLFIHPFLTDQPAVATFTASSLTVCEGGTITYDATGSTAQDTLVWVFDGAVTPLVVTDPNPTVQYDSAGTYTAHLFVVGGGCSQFAEDSLVITVLASPDVTVTAVDDTICAGTSAVLTATGALTYVWTPAATLIPAVGPVVTATPAADETYMVIGTNLAGCVDTAYQTITVLPVEVPYITIEQTNGPLCNDDTARFAPDSISGGGSNPVIVWYVNGLPADTAATFAYLGETGDNVWAILTNNDPCAFPTFDQSNVLTVIYGQRDTTTFNPVICQGDSALVNGVYQTVGGTYRDTLTNAGGCDSLIITNLTVNPTLRTNQTMFRCPGDSAFLAGAWQTASGIFNDTLSSAVTGCDSIVTTDLTIAPIVINTSQTICQGDSAFLQGAYQTAAGTYTDVFTASGGCDSTVNTTLNVIAPVVTNVTRTICTGDSAFLAGAYQTAAGVYNDTLASTVTGCDSIVTTDLTVVNAFTSSTTQTICQGDSAFLAGAFQTAPGSYVDTMTSTAGCDSIVTTVLSVSPTLTSNTTRTICQGDSALLGGAYQTTPGSYVDTLSSTASGCDSIVTTVLTVTPASVTNTTASICQGDSTFLGGAYQTTPGTYSDTTSSGGCLAITNTVLTVNPTVNTNRNFSICTGDSIFLAGAWRYASGIYTDSLTAATGCDSLVNNSLTVNSGPTINHLLSICQGDTVYIAGANRWNSGNFTEFFGCDSTVVTTLNVYNSYTFSIGRSICQGDSLFASGDWQTTTGTYIDSFQTINGCDSFYVTHLVVNTPAFGQVTITAPDTVCLDSNNIILGGSPAGGFWTGAGVFDSTFTPSMVGLTSGTEVGYWVYDSTGCGANAFATIVIEDCHVGIDETELASMRVYPNPTTGQFYLDIQGNVQGTVTISDLLGKQVSRIQVTQGNTLLDLSGEANGIYLVTLEYNGNLQHVKVMLAR
jgi:hypothetical protein